MSATLILTVFFNVSFLTGGWTEQETKFIAMPDMASCLVAKAEYDKGKYSPFKAVCVPSSVKGDSHG